MKGVSKDSYRLTQTIIRMYYITEFFIILLLISIGIPFLFSSFYIKCCGLMYMAFWIGPILSKIPRFFMRKSDELLLEINEFGILMVFHYEKKPSKTKLFPWAQIANYCVISIPDRITREYRGMYPSNSDYDTILIFYDIKGGRYYYNITEMLHGRLGGKTSPLLVYMLKSNIRKYAGRCVKERRPDDFDIQHLKKIS